MNYIAHAAGVSIMMAWWLFGIFAYGSHIAFTLVTIGGVAHSGQAFYLIAGILFPPLGVFNGVLVWIM